MNETILKPLSPNDSYKDILAHDSTMAQDFTMTPKLIRYVETREQKKERRLLESRQADRELDEYLLNEEAKAEDKGKPKAKRKLSREEQAYEDYQSNAQAEVDESDESNSQAEVDEYEESNARAEFNFYEESNYQAEVNEYEEANIAAEIPKPPQRFGSNKERIEFLLYHRKYLSQEDYERIDKLEKLNKIKRFKKQSLPKTETDYLKEKILFVQEQGAK